MPDVYSDVIGAVYNQIENSTFDFQIVPSDYLGSFQNGEEHVTVAVNVSGTTPYYARSASSRNTGFVAFSIFTESGRGPSRAIEIINQLSDRFVYEKIGRFNFMGGETVHMGLDKENKSYDSHRFVVNFIQYGDK